MRPPRPCCFLLSCPLLPSLAPSPSCCCWSPLDSRHHGSQLSLQVVDFCCSYFCCFFVFRLSSSFVGVFCCCVCFFRLTPSWLPPGRQPMAPAYFLLLLQNKTDEPERQGHRTAKTNSQDKQKTNEFSFFFRPTPSWLPPGKKTNEFSWLTTDTTKHVAIDK